MTKLKRRKFLVNLLKFSLPTVGVFLAQLQMGVDWQAALLVALYALYQATSDLVSKLK